MCPVQAFLEDVRVVSCVLTAKLFRAPFLNAFETLYVMKDSELPSDRIIDRLAEVSAMLHEEKGDREALLQERSRLLIEARRTGLITGIADRRSGS